VKDDRLYLIHVLECIERIEQYTEEGREAFLADTKTQDAVLRNMHTLSESTQRLSDLLKAEHPGVDWRSISGFRNIVVHDYLGVDLKQMWQIREKDIPDLKAEIRKMAAEAGLELPHLKCQENAAPETDGSRPDE